MKKLFLDTSVSKKANVKIFEGNSILVEINSDSSLLAIKEALEKTQLDLDDIDHFEANSGPGSYTGLRVGAAIINTLNWALKKDHQPIEPVYE